MLEPRDVQRYERELRAMLNRAADEDPEGFAVIAELVDQAHAAMPLAAQGLKRRGYPWRQIAEAMGQYTSAVHRKYAKVWAERAATPPDCALCLTRERHTCHAPNPIPAAIRASVRSLRA